MLLMRVLPRLVQFPYPRANRSDATRMANHSGHVNWSTVRVLLGQISQHEVI